MPELITVYRQGRFTTEPMPGFLAEALDRVSETNWQHSTEKELNAMLVRFHVDDQLPVPFYRLDQGAYVELEGLDGTFGSVWIPDNADIVPFLSQHVAPIVRMFTDSARLSQSIRIGSILHAIADERFDVSCEWFSGESNQRIREQMRKAREQGRAASSN